MSNPSIHLPMSPSARMFASAVSLAILLSSPAAQAGVADALPQAAHADSLPAYQPRFGRARPVVAVIGENAATEMTDYVIPYSLLAQSGKADVYALATAPGLVTMRPTTLKLVPQATAEQFDADHPEGADYVIVPAVVKRDDPRLLTWIRQQRDKGATLVSICDGALVLANAGVLAGRRATAHWYTDTLRREKYPATEWVRNTRYVVDGGIVSSAGISAAIPTSLRLVEAIAGPAVAAQLAERYGVPEWGTKHDSDAFVPRFGVNLLPYAVTNYLNGWLFRSEAIGVPLSPGVDDVAFALAMDAYSRTGRSKAKALSASEAPVETRSGLRFMPDLLASSGEAPARVLPAPAVTPGMPVFDRVLADIAALYGPRTARGVSYDFEYPWTPR